MKGSAMEKTSEQTYTDLLRQLGSPTVVEPAVLVGYLRDVERLHMTGRITDRQLERAKDAYADTIVRDPRQSPARIGEPVANGVPGVPGVTAAGSLNLDPITGTPGAHPVGTGLGAAMGGAVAGAAVGTVAGPLGTAIGAALGAVIGGLAGKGVAELVDPTVEETYWRSNFSTRTYVAADDTFDDYAPAYGYGMAAHHDHLGRTFEEAEAELSKGWADARGSSRLEWGRAKDATRDAWERAGQRG